MKSELQDYRVVAPRAFSLTDFDPAAEPLARGAKSKDVARLDKRVAAIAELQNTLFAEHKHGLLVLFQGLDTSGKDGAIYRVFGRVHPLGMRPYAFKAPSPEELEHDFLWRIHQHGPSQGEISVWNRSHYEDVVTARVIGVIDEAQCRLRYGHIKDFERLLHESGMRVVKIFLHISKDVQRRRLEARLTDPRKHWKFSADDLETRAHWKDHVAAYERAIENTATATAPWWVVPSDSKLHRDLMVAEIVYQALAEIDPQYPKLDRRFSGLRIK